MRKFNVIAAILGLGLGFAAAPANAASLIPQREGEIKTTNLGCIDSRQCINTSSFGFSVKSLNFDNDMSQKVNYGLSRLFVDEKGTANQYGTGKNAIKFGASDGGTTEGIGEFWLRAAAIQTNGRASEGGELEVGRFLFEFDQAIKELSLDFFDVELSGFSGILEINGKKVTDMLLASGPDGNIQTLKLNNVKSFIINLGKDDGKGKGDGVTLAGLNVKSVPEPTATFSLGALAVAGMFGVKKRKKLAN